MPGLIGIGQAYKQQATQGIVEDNNRVQRRNEENRMIKQAEKAENVQLAGIGAGIGAASAAALGTPLGWAALGGAALAYGFGKIL